MEKALKGLGTAWIWLKNKNRQILGKHWMITRYPWTLILHVLCLMTAVDNGNWNIAQVFHYANCETNALNDPKWHGQLDGQRDGETRLAKNIPILTLRECIFELFLVKNYHNSVHIRIKFKPVPKTTCKFLHYLWPLRRYFWAIFTQKNAIT